jgi:hypothetical protein
MTADCVHLVAGRALNAGIALAGDSASRTSALVATDTDNNRMLVERITKKGVITPVLTIPGSLPLAFDPSGTHLLYLVGHNPPTLTEATIAHDQLINAPWRNPQLGLGALAW